MPTLHDFSVKTIQGEDCSLGSYAGKVCLVVNVASKCGLTPQYDGLQRLYERLHPRGFEVLAFPCNQFGAQEPAPEAEIESFCQTNFGVSFPLFSKLDVNGGEADPLYGWLTSVDTQPEGSGDIKWNFGKFVVDGQGAVVGRFEPPTEPEDTGLVSLIEKHLG